MAGFFPYFGVRVHFPKGSSAFREACNQGIFEAGNAHVLQHLYRPGSVMFDVGANLGLMALPVLSAVPDSQVVSFEPSPNTLPWLRRTIAGSGLKNRWLLVEKAVSSKPGASDFSLSAPAEGLYDGLVHTRRSAESRRVKVEVTTLDEEWKRLNCPAVSVLKIDVEGGELEVLWGAQELLAQTCPSVLLEWCPLNLEVYHLPVDSLFHFARECRYSLYALPAMVPIRTPSELELHVIQTYSFLMSPLGAR